MYGIVVIASTNPDSIGVWCGSKNPVKLRFATFEEADDIARNRKLFWMVSWQTYAAKKIDRRNCKALRLSNGHSKYQEA